MHWIVATNLRDDSRGALEFAAWLHRHVRERSEHPATALAVIREGGFVDTGETRQLIEERVLEAASTFVRRSPARDVVDRVDVRRAEDVATALSEAAAAPDTALIMGRAAPRENRRLVRLGTVARRTLRRLGGPVVVVPPDWTTGLSGEGPIVVAVDATAPSLAAIAFAEQVAAAVGRPLLAVQAIRGVAALGSAFLTPAEFTESRDRQHRQEVEELVTFLADHGHGSLTVRSVPGPTLHTILDVAEDVEAAMIVCGSRRLSLVERIVSASVGSELASFARRPVVVVPPDYPA